MADPDEALIEAIAEALHGQARTPCDAHRDGECFYAPWARAAYAAIVEHLGLVEETRIECGQPVGEFLGHPMACGACQFIRPGACGVEIRKTRLVSRWTEVDHGSE